MARLHRCLRRLSGCLQRYDACVQERQGGDLPRQAADRAHGHNLTGQAIERPDLKFLLSTFVAVDDARQQLQPYAVDRSITEVPLGRLPLTAQEITEALDEAGHLVDRDQWHDILRRCASSS